MIDLLLALACVPLALPALSLLLLTLAALVRHLRNRRKAQQK